MIKASNRPAPEQTLAAASAVLARLLREAEKDRTLRSQIRFLVSLPDVQRESLVNTALEQMKLQGEPAEIRAAFAVLATEEGASLVREEIGRG